MTELVLSSADRAMLAGEHGPGTAMAMRIIVGLAQAMGAPRLIDISGAHIDGCLYHGPAGLDFAQRLVDLGAHVDVPTTLNVGSLDLLHPGLVRMPPQEAAPARRLMDAYVALGAAPSWTCAPYQEVTRPAYGSDVAWAESNAIVFANSVLGARTARYGDFADICAAITARVPDGGLHRPENRIPRLRVDCEALSRALLGNDAAWAALGQVVGQQAGETVPLLTGIDPDVVDEDKLKAFGAAAASAGGLALFHLEGVTPEACREQGSWPEPERTLTVTPDQIRATRDELTTAAGTGLDAVCLGTPHFSVAEFAALARALAGTGPFAATVIVSTSRAVFAEAERQGHLASCTERGATILTDTCSYVTPVLDPGVRTVMTNSGKWAWYAPANLGVEVVFGSLAECVASACAGRVVRDESQWA